MSEDIVTVVPTVQSFFLETVIQRKFYKGVPNAQYFVSTLLPSEKPSPGVVNYKLPTIGMSHSKWCYPLS